MNTASTSEVTNLVVGAVVLPLTPRQRQIVSLLLEGFSNKEIARQLGVKPRTVKQQIYFTSYKLNVRTAERHNIREAIILKLKKPAEEVTPIEALLLPSERRIAKLICQGLSYREIANVISNQPGSVKNCAKLIFDKIGVWSKVELILYALARGGAACFDYKA